MKTKKQTLIVESSVVNNASQTTQKIATQNLLDTPVACMSFQKQMQVVHEWAKARQSKTVCLANVHMLVEAHKKPEFSQVLQNADLITPDGMPLVWMLRKLANPQQDRVAGMDVFSHLCKLASKSGVSIFLVGSRPEVLEKMTARLSKEFPRLKVAGAESLPFRPMTESEDEALIEQINQSGAGLTFVCLGCPKQEAWMELHRDKIQSVMLGVGAVFEVYAGIKKHAPDFIRNSGMEWAYRLVQEPKRLWSRYYKTNSAFIYLAAKNLIQHYLESKNSMLETPVAN